MRIAIFGATGMVGQGVLRECLADPGVAEVLAVGRAPAAAASPKLRNLVHADLFDLSPVAGELRGLDACCFCLGVSAAGMSEAAYRHVTYDLTLAVARTLAGLNPGSAFLYVSGKGADSSARGRIMWARVKGDTENALMALPFKAAYMFRPGLIQPLHGIRSRTRWYRLFYALTAPLYPALKAAFPGSVTTTERMGRAMLAAVRGGGPSRIVENADINRLAGA